ncbi:hypothetical protein BJ508DRAFT_323709 [Ascobolus immersus RN42]|uniref:F-box domain-containing protein n=1 Tax=Ascobolus immersus RN42 TaxID=1160509 RepID=A0A3N4IE73_ASCIM|nr:hypothetical protein BJ508DRAFT_323709 [Ascobolus immersus RN42]
MACEPLQHQHNPPSSKLRQPNTPPSPPPTPKRPTLTQLSDRFLARLQSGHAKTTHGPGPNRTPLSFRSISTQTDFDGPKLPQAFPTEPTPAHPTTPRRLPLPFRSSSTQTSPDDPHPFPTPQTSPPPVPRLLLLPTELRLSIYTFSTAFTLLHLSHTCFKLRAEINSVPDIYTKAEGYGPHEWIVLSGTLDRSCQSKLSIFNIHSLAHTSEALLYERRYLDVFYASEHSRVASLQVRGVPPRRKSILVCDACLIFSSDVEVVGRQAYFVEGELLRWKGEFLNCLCGCEIQRREFKKVRERWAGGGFRPRSHCYGGGKWLKVLDGKANGTWLAVLGR